MIPFLRAVGSAWLAAAMLGCADKSGFEASKSVDSPSAGYFETDAKTQSPAAAAPQPIELARAGEDSPPDASKSEPQETAGERANPAGGAVQPADIQPLSRKIIYNAYVDLTIDNFDRGAERIERLVAESGGFLASSEMSGSPGSGRRGVWTARVPVAKFSTFLDALSKIGEPVRKRISSEDISRKFYDVEARIRNKKNEEARLIKLLQEATGKLKDVIDVEREVSRVREEIETMQSQINQWSSLSALSTVTISLVEFRDYVPPESPSFGVRISRAFMGSLDRVGQTCKSLIIEFVAFVPWLPFWIVGAVFVWAAYRLIKRFGGLQITTSRRI